jgi:superfamily I DNA/RNA helicase
VVRSKTAGKGVNDVTRLTKHLLKSKRCTSGQILVLVPRRAFARGYVEAFTKAHINAVNYVRPGDVLDRPAVRKLMYALKLGTSPEDPIAVRAMLDLAGGIGPAKIKAITTVAISRRQPFPAAARDSANVRVRAVLTDLGKLPHVDGTIHWPEALKVIATHLGTPQTDLDELIAFIKTIVPDETEEIERCLLVIREFRIDSQSSGDYPPDGPVRVMTMGQAKGLSAPVVLLTDLDDEIVPGAKPEDEQRRILYVAMTRAEWLLYLFYCVGRKNSPTAYAGIGSSQVAGGARSLSHFLQDLSHEARDISDLLA